MSQSEKKIAVVYYSGSEHTRLMADAILRGAGSVPGVSAQSHRISGDDINKGRWENDAALKLLQEADAIIFGTPTYMGSVAAQFKAFADATGTIWYMRGWKGKLAAGFTHSGSPSGDKSSTLQYLATLAAQHGMIWLNQPELPSQYTGSHEQINRLGFYLGAAGNTPFRPGEAASVEAGDVLTAEKHGRHVAESVLRFAAVEVTEELSHEEAAVH